MAATLRSLAYQTFTVIPPEGKAGYVLYDGGPNDYFVWEFKLDIKLSTIVQVEEKPEKAKIAFKNLISNLVESLRGKALKIAYDIGVDELMEYEDMRGLKQLRKEIKENVFPQIDEEVRAVYQEGQKIGGILARQQGEPIRSYITRREKMVCRVKKDERRGKHS